MAGVLSALTVEPELADYSASQTMLGISVAFALWTSLYTVFCVLNSKKSYEWNCRIVSTVHAVIVVCTTFWSGCIQGPFPFTDPGNLLKYRTKEISIMNMLPFISNC